MYVWERKSNRNIVFTGAYNKNCRYLRFLSRVNKMVAGATLVMVVKVLTMVI
jgi:hypothetical protein